MNEPYVFKKGDECYVDSFRHVPVRALVTRAYKTAKGGRRRRRISVATKHGERHIFELVENTGRYRGIDSWSTPALYTITVGEFVIASSEMYDDFKKLGLLVEKAQNAVRDDAGTNRLRQLRALIQGVLSRE